MTKKSRLFSHKMITLRIKIRYKNLTGKGTQTWTEKVKSEASYFTIKLCPLNIKNKKKKGRKRDDSNIQVHNTIFSKYLALPIATFPLLLLPPKFI